MTGDVEQATYFNGKTYSAPQPISTFDSWANCSVQHTFAIPSLGINVPIASVTTLKENNNLCGTSPCTANNASDERIAPHTVVKFSFKTPDHERDLPLAVLRPMRSRLRGRQRRPDGQRGLHDGGDGGVSLMAADASSASGTPVVAGRKSDAKVLLITWIVASVIATLIVALVWGPHMPPGRASTTAASQQFDYQVLGSIATPVVVGVLLYFGYALIFWRRKPGDDTDAAPLHGNTKIQATWVIGTSAGGALPRRIRNLRADRPRRRQAPGEGPQPIWKRPAPRQARSPRGRLAAATSCRCR